MWVVWCWSGCGAPTGLDDVRRGDPGLRCAPTWAGLFRAFGPSEEIDSGSMRRVNISGSLAFQRR